VTTVFHDSFTQQGTGSSDGVGNLAGATADSGQVWVHGSGGTLAFNRWQVNSVGAYTKSQDLYSGGGSRPSESVAIAGVLPSVGVEFTLTAQFDLDLLGTGGFDDTDWTVSIGAYSLKVHANSVTGEWSVIYGATSAVFSYVASTTVVMAVRNASVVITVNGVEKINVSNTPATSGIGLSMVHTALSGGTAIHSHMRVTDLLIDTFDGNSGPPVLWVYDSFTGANNTQLVAHTGEVGATWAIPVSSGDGPETIILTNNAMARPAWPAAGNSGEAMAYPSGRLPTGTTQFTIEFGCRFMLAAGGSGYIDVIEHANDPSNVDTVFGIAFGFFGVGHEFMLIGQPGYVDNSTGFTAVDGQEYIVRLVINGGHIDAYLDGVLKVSCTRPLITEPFGLDINDNGGLNCPQVTYLKIYTLGVATPSIFWTDFVETTESVSTGSFAEVLELVPAPEPPPVVQPKTGIVYCNAVTIEQCNTVGMSGVSASGPDIGVYVEFANVNSYINLYGYSNTLFTVASDANASQGFLQQTGTWPAGPAAAMAYVFGDFSAGGVGHSGYKRSTPSTSIDSNGLLGTPDAPQFPAGGSSLWRFKAGGSTYPVECVNPVSPPRQEIFMGNAANGSIFGWCYKNNNGVPVVTKFKVYDWGAVDSSGTPPADPPLTLPAPFVYDTFTGSSLIATHVGEIGASWTREYTFSDVNWAVSGGVLARNDYAGGYRESYIHPSGRPPSTHLYLEIGMVFTVSTSFFELGLLVRGCTRTNTFAETVQDGIEAYVLFGGSAGSTQLRGRWSGGGGAITPFGLALAGTHVMRLEVNGSYAELFWDGASMGSQTVTGITSGYPLGWTEFGDVAIAMGGSSSFATPNEVRLDYIKAGSLDPIAPPVSIFWREFVKTAETDTGALRVIEVEEMTLPPPEPEPLLLPPPPVVTPQTTALQLTLVDSFYTDMQSDEPRRRVAFNTAGTYCAVGVMNNYGPGAGVFPAEVWIYKLAAGHWSRVAQLVTNTYWDNIEAWQVAIADNLTVLSIGNNSAIVHRWKSTGTDTWASDSYFQADPNNIDSGSHSGVAISADGNVCIVWNDYDGGLYPTIFTGVSGTGTPVLRQTVEWDASVMGAFVSPDGKTIVVGMGYPTSCIRFLISTTLGNNSWTDSDGVNFDPAFGAIYREIHCIRATPDLSLIAVGCTRTSDNAAVIEIIRHGTFYIGYGRYTTPTLSYNPVFSFGLSAAGMLLVNNYQTYNTLSECWLVPDIHAIASGTVTMTNAVARPVGVTNTDWCGSVDLTLDGTWAVIQGGGNTPNTANSLFFCAVGAASVDWLLDTFDGTGTVPPHNPSVGGPWVDYSSSGVVYALDGSGFISSQLLNSNLQSVLASPSGTSYTFEATFTVTNIVAGNTNRVLIDLFARNSSGGTQLDGFLNYHDSTYSITPRVVSSAGNYTPAPITITLPLPVLNQVYTFAITVSPGGTVFSIDGQMIASTPIVPDAIPYDAGFFAYSPGGVSILKIGNIRFGPTVAGSFWTSFVETSETP